MRPEVEPWTVTTLYCQACGERGCTRHKDWTFVVSLGLGIVLTLAVCWLTGHLV